LKTYNIIELYNKGLTLKEIGNKIGYSETTIFNKLKKNNIERRKTGPKRKISINDNVFSSFNKNSCYWAGFLGADGCIFGNQISINLHLIDYNHLEKFKEFVEVSSKVIKKNNSCYIKFRSDIIRDDLKRKFNIGSCKSLVIQPPENMPVRFDRHYIRGYFDGDGSLCCRNPLSFEIYSGSKYILEWCRNKIKHHVNLTGGMKVSHKHGNCFRISFGGKQVIKIMDWLYEDCEANFLDRKRKKYKIFMEE